MAEPTPSTPQLVSMAQQFTGLPMNDLIGVPLMAAATANSQMGMTQVKYMLDLCFKNKTDTSDPKNPKTSYEPVMIDMSMTRHVIVPSAEESTDGKISAPLIKPMTTNIKLPLLTIIPLNSLAVETVDVNFDMEVKSSYSEEHTESHKKDLKAESSFEAKIGYGIFSATIKGSVSYDSSSEKSAKSHYEKSNSAKYTVAVHAGQLPLPQGVNVIIQAYTNNIGPIELPAEKKSPPPSVS